MKLMIDTKVPLSEIALATGFSDQAHFSNKFRRAAGMTPTQWRKTHQRKSESERTGVQYSPHSLR